MEVIETSLNDDDNWKQHTDLEKHHILDLLRFVLDDSFFVFEGVFYHQIFGCAMGSPVSAIIAEIVMNYVETKALAIRFRQNLVGGAATLMMQMHV